MGNNTEYKYAKRPILSSKESSKKYKQLGDKFGPAMNWLAGNGTPEDKEKRK